MDPILGLVLLYLLARKGGAASSAFASHVTTSPPHPSTGPSAFPPVPATAAKPPVPSPSVQAGKKWQPYHPLNQAVIARAEQLLHDSTMKPNDERIEPDPAGGGVVRYLKVGMPPGRISVTAWKPSLAPTAPTATGPKAPSRSPAKKSIHALSG